MKIVALAGGVGGAKLAVGFAGCLAADDFSVIVNTGDDFDHLGLRICPDIDTVCYTLAGLSNPDTGWGRKDETWNGLKAIQELGGPAWFRLGDGDTGTHLVRTHRLKNGEPLSAIVESFCKSWGIRHTVMPMTDDPVRTGILTSTGELLDFQEYFVRLGCRPVARSIVFEGAKDAVPAPGVLESIEEADFVVICPSNPWVSIDPILAVPGIRQQILEKKVVAVSPIIGGKAIKGPAAKMYEEFGISPSALAVGGHYEALIDGFVFDRTDQDLEAEFKRRSIMTLVTDTIMTGDESRKRLAAEILEFCDRLRTG